MNRGINAQMQSRRVVVVDSDHHEPLIAQEALLVEFRQYIGTSIVAKTMTILQSLQTDRADGWHMSGDAEWAERQ